MPSPRPFRFATDVNVTTRADLLAHIRRCEQVGFSTIIGGEHPSSGGLGQIATLASVAMASTSLHVASQVFANDFRNPVLLAREAATIDILANGRFEFGLGTGWAQADYDQMGIPFDSPGVRVDRFIEALRIIKALFRGEPYAFQGKYYTVREHTGLKSMQRPHPRLFIGGGGKRMLALAAREADIVGLNTGTTSDGQLDFATITAEAMAQKVAWVRKMASERFDSLELHLLVLAVIITNDRRKAAAQILEDIKSEPIVNGNLSIDDLLESPYLLIGTVDQMVEALIARRERYGISYVAVFGESMDPFCQVVSRLAG